MASFLVVLSCGGWPVGGPGTAAGTTRPMPDLEAASNGRTVRIGALVRRQRRGRRCRSSSTWRGCWSARASPTRPRRRRRRWRLPIRTYTLFNIGRHSARASTSAIRRTARCGAPRPRRPRAARRWRRPARSSPTTARRPRCSTRRRAAATPRRAGDVWARGALFPYLAGRARRRARRRPVVAARALARRGARGGGSRRCPRGAPRGRPARRSFAWRDG